MPNAVFTAVPLTAKRLSETWPKNTKAPSPLSTALGSVGNLAQAVVVGHTARPGGDLGTTANTSSAKHEESEGYETEGNYAEVDETILKNLSSSRGKETVEGQYEGPKLAGTKEEVIYATVNKRRKPQVGCLQLILCYLCMRTHE